MTNESFLLAYAAENADQADVLLRKFAALGVYPSQLQGPSDSSTELFSKRLQSTPGHLVLLLSDNLLKSLDCLDGMLESARSLLQEDRLTIVVIDGVERVDDGQAVAVKTRIDTLTHVIRYMNFWQQAYLDIRGMSRDILPADRAEYDANTLRVRSVSSEIGEFLRLLRTTNCLSIEEFADQNFRQFFRSAGLTDLLKESDNQQPNGVVRNGHESGSDKQAEGTGKGIHPTVHSKLDSSVDDSSEEEEERTEQTRVAGERQAIEAMQLRQAQVEQEIRQKDEQAKGLVEPPTASDTGGGNQEEKGIFGGVYLPGVTPSVSSSGAPGTQPAAPTHQRPDEVEEGSDEPPADQPNEAPVEAEEPSEVEQEEPAPTRPVHRETGAEGGEERIAHIAQSAVYFAQTGEVEQGLSLLRALLKKHPENVFVRYRLAVYLLRFTDQESEAVHHLETVLADHPEYAAAYVRLAEIAENRKDHLLAHHYLEKASDLNPEYPEIHYRLGLLTQLHFPDKRDEIMERYRKAVRADKYNVDARYRYATLLSEIAGNERKAVRHFNRTLELQPDHPFANYDLALLYFRLGDRDQAAHHYRMASQVNPEVKTDINDRAFFGHIPDQATAGEQPTVAVPIRIAGKPGQVAWITGATSGIGRATAEVFAQAGYRLILTGRRADRLHHLKSHLEQAWQAECLTFSHDVRDIEALRADVNSLEGPWRQVDVLVNNAGLAKGLAPVHQADVTHWETMIDTNIKGLLFMTRLIAPLMVARGNGHIINVCSVAGKEVYPNGNVYCATKHAVDALTRAMRLDLHTHGIRVSQVSPGHVEETEFALVRFDGDASKAQIYDDFQPLAAPDVAETIYFIATRPPHVTIQDVLLFGSQQASANHIHRSGRPAIDDEEE